MECVFPDTWEIFNAFAIILYHWGERKNNIFQSSGFHNREKGRKGIAVF